MNEAEKTRISVDIFGTTYKLMGSYSVSHMKAVVSHVNEQMHRIADSNGRLDTPKIAVLAAVNMADDYYKIKQKLEALQEENASLRSEAASYKSLAKENEQLKLNQKESEEAKNALEFNVRGLQLQLQEQAVRDKEREQQIARLQEEKQSLADKLRLETGRLTENLRNEEEKHRNESEAFAAEKQRLETESAREIQRREQEWERLLAEKEQEWKSEAEQTASDLDRGHAEMQKEWELQLEAERNGWQQRLQVIEESFRQDQKDEERSWTERLERLAEEKESLLQHNSLLKEELAQEKELTASNQGRELELQKQLDILREEYEKLKKEYNEWLELVMENKAADR